MTGPGRAPVAAPETAVPAARPPEPPRWQGRPAWLEIDLDALRHNVRALTAWVTPGTRVMAVVKADAYGLGAVPVAEAALAGGAAWLGVASVEEGVQLRQAGIDAPILVLGPSTAWEMPQVVASRLTITLNDLEVARALAAVAFQCRVRAPVHLKLDTGLNRFGRHANELLALADAVAPVRGVRLEGLYTHFANAEDPVDDFAPRQLQRLLAVNRRLAARGHAIRLLHAASSSAILTMPAAHLDLVRAGILISGHLPAPGLGGVPLRPAVTLWARIARLAHLDVGDTVGYGRTYQAPGPRTIGLIPVGYADGYHRALSNRGFVLIAGRRAPVVGRVSMDQITVDVTDVPGVREGDPVVVAGGTDPEGPGFETLADLAGTIAYELLTHLGRRLPRVYLRGGAVVELTTLLGNRDLSLLEPLGHAPARPPPAAEGWEAPGEGGPAWPEVRGVRGRTRRKRVQQARRPPTGAPRA